MAVAESLISSLLQPVSTCLLDNQRIRQIKKENHELIEQKTQELLQSLPDVVDTTRLDIETAKQIYIEAKKDINTLTPEKLQFKTLTNKVNADMFRAIGFYPYQSQSFFIQNIYNDNRSQQAISNQVMAALGEYIKAEIIEKYEY